MATFFQPITLPDRCLLSEVLYWVAFQRLPIFETDHEGVDVRQSTEVDSGYVIRVGDEFLDPEECKRASIPDDPTYLALIEETTTLSVAHYEEMAKKYPDINADSFREEIAEAKKYQSDCEAWEPHYLNAIEYPASKIFVALKSGQLRGSGRLLPTLDIEEATELDQDIFNIEATEIPPEFWSLQGIDFEASAARNRTSHYCHITFHTDQVFSVFPGEREPVGGIERVGSALVVADSPRRPTTKMRRGRPPYPWDPFHVEIAGLLRKGALPDKKEAAIEHFQDWFFKQLGIRPSRAAIGEKLTPYYEKYVRRGGQKM